MNLKVKVTPEESKRVEEILFRMGYEWASSRRKKVRYTDSPYLIILDSKCFGYFTSLEQFNSYPHKEVTPSYFEKFDTKLWKVLNEA